MNNSTFIDRRDAGRRLASVVKTLKLIHPVVLALPRGGVPVGFEVAAALCAPLDVLTVRKIGAPGHEEYGIGAVVDGIAHQVVIDEAMARAAGASREYIDMQTARKLAEIEKRRTVYRAETPVQVKNRDVVLVDDGIATGGTVRAALAGLIKAKPARIVLAVPLAPADVLNQLEKLLDQVICLASPTPFHSVGLHYHDFSQTQDEEVVCLLDAARSQATPHMNSLNPR